MKTLLMLTLAFAGFQSSAQTMPKVEKEYLCVWVVSEDYQLPLLVKTKTSIEGIEVRFTPKEHLSVWNFTCTDKIEGDTRTTGKCNGVEIRNDIHEHGKGSYSLVLKKIDTNQIELTSEADGKIYAQVRCQKREI